MNYVSTRGKETQPKSAAYAIKTGLACDGGLFMPENIPSLTLSEIEDLANKSYPERCADILSRFLTDYSYEELLEDSSIAYAKEKFSDGAAPVTSLGDNTYMLELWHGPTSAFKDMALQIMPRLFTRALKKCGEERTALILVATSGDTGKAALEGYHDIDGVKIKVYYPELGVSSVQKKQMQTQEGKNVSVTAIKGNFDDAQSGVKKIFSDAEFSKVLDSEGVFLSSANSINWGRLVPQIVYYVSAYCDLLKSGKIALGEKIDVCVPTGNFGNIFAAYIAKLMGLPIEKLVCASNKNNILTDFLKTGVYDKNREFYATMSPSMDILISSNLERLLYLVCGAEKCAAYMKDLKENGEYKIAKEELDAIKSVFDAGFANDETTLEVIKNVYEKHGYIMDTHTAVAWKVYEDWAKENDNGCKSVVLSTASAYKFSNSVMNAIGKEYSDEFDALEKLNAITGAKIPGSLVGIKEKPVVHKNVVKREDMLTFVSDMVGKKEWTK